MLVDLCQVVLKNGEEVRAGVVVGPDAAWAEKVEALLEHKGDPWNWQNGVVLRDDVGIDARFFLLHRDGRPFANIMTVERRGVGILGHVWTKPEDRRQGAASALLDLSLSDFSSRRGQALFLGTGFDSPTFHLYARHGFSAIEDKSGTMVYYSESKEEFECSYFKDGPTCIEPLTWQHWPSAPALFLGDFAGVVRCIRLKLFGRASPEEVLLPLLREENERRQKEESSTAMMLVQAETSAVVGFATWGWHPIWPGACTVDVYCHPDFWGEASSLLSSLTLPDADFYLAYGDPGCEQKHEVLGKAGFVQRAHFSKRVPANRARTSYADVIEFQRS